MIDVVVREFADWRNEARKLLTAGQEPSWVRFVDERLGQPSLNLAPAPEPETPGPTRRVTREFLSLAETVSHFREPERWDLMYRVLWRVTHGEPHLLEVDVDSDIHRLRAMEKAVRRDMHKMRAFVRFREVATPQGPEYIAWHRPEHYIVKANAPFFVRRFGSMRWAILTPDDSAYWDCEQLRFGPGAPRSAAPDADVLENLWRTYYSSIFNPARVNLKAMTTEMAVRHWSTLPEAEVIQGLLRDARGRVQGMMTKQPASAEPWVPPGASLPVLAEAISKCEGCELFRHATQAVFGDGPPAARVMMVGEQPGDEEDLSGKPFVGPAGRLLNKAMDEAKLDRSQIYVTNAVKHFKFEERGKRRIHQKPNGVEVSACRPWLEAEVRALSPALIVCLGATAGQSMMGRDFRVTQDRGQFLDNRWGSKLLGTIHPSALLRMPDRNRYEEEYRLFVRDLSMARDFLRAV